MAGLKTLNNLLPKPALCTDLRALGGVLFEVRCLKDQRPLPGNWLPRQKILGPEGLESVAVASAVDYGS